MWNGNPLQCSCLENPRDGGVWWAAIYGVAQGRTRLKRLSSSSSSVENPEGNVKMRRFSFDISNIFKRLSHRMLLSVGWWFSFTHSRPDFALKIWPALSTCKSTISWNNICSHNITLFSIKIPQPSSKEIVLLQAWLLKK